MKCAAISIPSLLIPLAMSLGAFADPAARPTPQLSEPQRRQASALARQSIELLESHHLPEAEAKMRQALAIIPTKATWLYNLACIQGAEGNLEAAMTSLEKATDAGFTDFNHLERNGMLAPLRKEPRYQKLLEQRDRIRHHAAELALNELKEQFGPSYLYEADEAHKLVFAAAVDQPTLDALHQLVLEQMASQEEALFSHASDEFIRIVIPTPRDFRKWVPRSIVTGIYIDETRTLIAQHMGQVMVHEFTHALHAADQHAEGQVHPVWLREGLASMYEAGTFEEGKLIPADNYRLGFIQQAARRKAVIPLEKLLRYTTEQFTANANLAYGQSSSLLLYLHEQKQLRAFYDAYKAGYGKDQSGTQALEAATGMSLPALQQAWTQWMLDRPAPPARTGLGSASIGMRFIAENDGVKITLLLPGGAGFKAGLKIGDVIVGVDDRDVRDPATLLAVLSAHKADDTLTLKIRRAKEYLSRPVTLGKR